LQRGPGFGPDFHFVFVVVSGPFQAEGGEFFNIRPARAFDPPTDRAL
jgi:hypothetical protein